MNYQGSSKRQGSWSRHLSRGKEASAASGNTFVGVVQAGEGCDDAKVLTPAMDAATKQCSDKAIRHPSILGVNGCEWNKPEEASVSARRKGKA